LTDAEVDVLIQFKLEGGNESPEANGSRENSSNAARQRMKRLVAKLRRLAR